MHGKGKNHLNLRLEALIGKGDLPETLRAQGCTAFQVSTTYDTLFVNKRSLTLQGQSIGFAIPAIVLNRLSKD
jgi:hypothetical protein